MTIERDGDLVFDDTTSMSKIVRTCEELTSYLTRCNAVSEVAVLLTGTGLVPPEEFTLHVWENLLPKRSQPGRLILSPTQSIGFSQ